MAPLVAVLGSCIVDNITYVDVFPQPGETVVGRIFKTGCGGKGANQAVAASKLGADVHLIGMLGDDLLGRFYQEGLSRTTVNCDLVTVSKQHATGIATITVNKAGENCIAIIPGANSKVTEAELQAAEPVLQRAAILVCQGEINMDATRVAMVTARQRGVKTLMNAAPVTADLHPDIIKNSDVFCVNETEAQSLSGQSVASPQQGLAVCRELLQEGCGAVVLTMGAAGVVFCNQEGQSGHIPAEEVTPVDCTGAGDAFVGALAYFMVHHTELGLAEMIKRSCVVASASVLKEGTQSSFPTRQDLPQQLFQ